MSRTKLRDAPPFRADPWAPDSEDSNRIQYIRGLWHGQDDVLRQRDKSIEENLRMLAGQQNLVWNPFLQRWYDVSQYMSTEERKWRQRPVINRLLYWFTLTHSRMTENPPICAFKPASADRIDALLAEAMDTVCKTVWSQANMDDVIDERTSWLIPCGEVYTISRLDLNAGDLVPRIGPAMLQGNDAIGRPMELYADAVPYDEQGQPLAELGPDGSYQVTGEPFVEPEGQIAVDVLTPLQVRGSWGNRPWHKKSWHMMYEFMSCQEIYDRFGVEVEPESEPSLGTNNDLGKILYGSGYFGSMSGREGSEGNVQNYSEGFTGVWAFWQRPALTKPELRETPDSPGGRLIICTKTACLYDGPREARWRYTSPIRRYGFVRVPGRPAFTSPQEPQNALQRMYNKGWGQILEHRDRCTNPIGVVDHHSGIKLKDITNRPGQLLKALRRPSVPVLEFIAPARLGDEVWRSQDLMLREMKDFGALEGSEGKPPTLDASGELVKELRANSDRYLSATQRRSVTEDARMLEDWVALLEVSWTQERIVSTAGEDSAAVTLMVYPEMFKDGRVNVVPDLESALPEGRGERQAKMLQLYRDGVFGPPGTPEAARVYLEMFRFPHLGRVAQFGRTDGVTARQENGRLAQGEPAQLIPMFEWYDDLVHIMVHEEYMKGPEFLQLDPMIQQQFQIHWTLHQMRFQAALAQQAAQQAAAQGQGGGEPGGGGGEQGGGPPQPAAAA